MPEVEHNKKTPMVDIDTSAPDMEVELPEVKPEGTVIVNEKPIKEEEVKEEIKEEIKEEVKEEVREATDEIAKEDEKLEDYSKGVQSRIAKLTRKMREAERREKAATEYALSLEKTRKSEHVHYNKLNTDYTKKFESNIKTGMESAQRELAASIESGDAAGTVEANKRIASLAFENAKLEQRKQASVEQRETTQLSDGGYLPQQTPRELPNVSDPKAETWAAENKWFGQDRAMTFTAFEIHKDLVENEGYDPKTEEYYVEVNKRIRVDFPHKFGNTTSSPRAVQSVASVQRSVKPGRKTVRLTSSQVAIAKKLGVPLEEYAKQLKLTKEI